MCVNTSSDVGGVSAVCASAVLRVLFLHISPSLGRLVSPKDFMTFVVEPLFTEWARFSNTQLSQCMLDHMARNKAHWKGDVQEPAHDREEQDSNSKTLPQGSRESWPLFLRQVRLGPGRSGVKGRYRTQQLLPAPSANAFIAIGLPASHLYTPLIFISFILTPFPHIEQYIDTSCCFLLYFCLNRTLLLIIYYYFNLRDFVFCLKLHRSSW